MKAIRIKCQYVIILLVSMLAFTSCDIEIIGNDNGYYENSRFLCNNPWMDEWVDTYRCYHYRELVFFPDGTGEIYTYVEDEYGRVMEKSTVYMEWEWRNHSYTSLCMYFRGKVSYIDDIYPRGYDMECRIDDVPVVLKPVY